ncbi:histidine phosphatase family protein [Mucilaginibacter terrae]|uniref:histidine phosphatase family protein n=1 Tax=Mucilaginibacter terrae TaxID=1955052 RepID=UPI0036393EA3
MVNKTLIILFFTAFTLSKFNALAQSTTIYLVRHAEKLTVNPAERDPNLSDKGFQRAADLAKVLQKKKINTIYSTNYKRTLATAMPLATYLQLAPVIYNVKDPSTIAIKASQDNKGKTALIVGHSNTLIPVIKALNCSVPFEGLTDDDYDMLFKVVIDENGKANLTVTNYGEVHHTTDSKNKKVMTAPIMN